ncbi:serine protease inhibitor dipetalogastin-like [Armigeres subalbatus]|uniref:serine protease inhibitor dipetalogastin-like n=1 Tax=Armigeres subalbatus TaxID=124917 RepID=UPI002ED281CC
MTFELIKLIPLITILGTVLGTYIIYPPRYELSDTQNAELQACLQPTRNAGAKESKYDPICGTDGFSYYNKYQMRCIGKSIPSVAFAFYGRCPNEPLFLPLESARGMDLLGNSTAFESFQKCLETCGEFTPICGSDGRTYTSECALLCGKTFRPKLEVRGTGFCAEDKTVQDHCPEILQPFCGSDGVTYLNYCQLKFTMVEQKDLVPAHMGDCVRRLIAVQGASQRERKSGGCGGGCGGCCGK